MSSDNKRRKEIKNKCLRVVVEDSISRLETEIDINRSLIASDNDGGFFDSAVFTIRKHQKTITTLKHFLAIGDFMNSTTHCPIEDALSFCINDEYYIAEVPKEVEDLIEEKFKEHLPYGFVVFEELKKRGECKQYINEIRDTMGTYNSDKEHKISNELYQNGIHCTCYSDIPDTELTKFYTTVHKFLKEKEQQPKLP